MLLARAGAVYSVLVTVFAVFALTALLVLLAGELTFLTDDEFENLLSEDFTLVPFKFALPADLLALLVLREFEKEFLVPVPSPLVMALLLLLFCSKAYLLLTFLFLLLKPLLGCCLS